MRTSSGTKFTSATAKSFVTKAGLRFYPKHEAFYSHKAGFQTATIWGRKEDAVHGYGDTPVGLEYFGGKDYKEVTMLKMRLWLTEQGIKYTLEDDYKIILVDDSVLSVKVGA